MTDMTIPGTIPGLLRRGSPVCILGTHPDGFPGKRGVCTVVYGDGALVGTAWDHLWDGPIAMLALDLTDATGRAHAAWWLVRNSDPYALGRFFAREGLDVPRFSIIVEMASTGDDLSGEDILFLRRIILHVVGTDDNG